MMKRIDHDADWEEVALHWELDERFINLNHGSFGPPSDVVRKTRDHWMSAMDRQPMEFFVRQVEPALRHAREKLADFIGADTSDLVPVDNATYGMNVVASSFCLEPGDRVIVNNHEYGAVRRIWERACESQRAFLDVVELPARFGSQNEIVDPIMDAVQDSTRLIVASHITSPTAIVFPIEELCARARERGVSICVDGPHAVAQLPLDLNSLGCDFYTASCHKWLAAAFGSGFLYAAPKWHDEIRPPILSWGRLLPNTPETWDEEFLWRGTANMSSFLTIPAAIAFLQEVGLESYRDRTHWLASYARERLERICGAAPVTPENPDWYGSMALIELPDRDWSKLQQILVSEHRIEVPVIAFADKWFLRVSCHLHTMTTHIDRLCEVLHKMV